MTSDRANLRRMFARQLGISPRLIDYAAEVREKGVPELEAMVMAGTITVSAAALLSREPHDRQREILATTPPRKIRAALRGEVADRPCPHCQGTGRVPLEGDG